MSRGVPSLAGWNDLRTVIVDDSALARLMLREAFHHIPGVRIVGNASDGQAAIDVIDEIRPDLVTLDIEMPGMNGIEILRHLKSRHPRLPVLMCSRLAEASASVTAEALLHGAFDFILKPTHRSRDENVRELRQTISDRIRPLLDQRQLSEPDAAWSPGREPAAWVSPTPQASARNAGCICEMLLIGSSTGGPAALRSLLSGLAPGLNAPVCVIQHIPVGFSHALAHRLNQICPLDVVEAEAGMPIGSGTVYLAPAGYHLLVERVLGVPQVALGDGEAEHGCRPAIDVALRSAANVFGARAWAVILTGMGRDGAAGAKAIRSLGGRVLVQSVDSSTVSSMPRQTLEAAGADFVGSPCELSRCINDWISG